MRYFFRARHPEFKGILLVESGSRHILENFLPVLRRCYGELPIALITCYAGLPAGFPSETRVFRVSNYAGRSARKLLYRELSTLDYPLLGVVCSGEPIMTKWKWALGARLPAKILVINENSDFFWLDRTNWRTICHFASLRAGLSGAQALPLLMRLALFPFTLSYLLLFAATAHCRRLFRLRLRKV